MTLGDLGAEIWKVENPHEGDETRSWRPPVYLDTSTYFLSVNRNKASIALDFSTSDGQAIVRDLAARADILVENYLTGALARYGLDYDSLAAVNPRLIYCSISGYGRTGALAKRAGYDFLIQGESGLMAITGEAGGSPQKLGVAICDVIAGMNGSQAVLAALYARERTGRGQLLDIALLDSAIAALINVGSGSLNGGGAAKRYGNAHPSIVPYEAFDAADAPFVLACANNRQFRDLCEGALKRPEVANDPRFATNALRVVNRGALSALLAEHFAKLPVAEIVAACTAVNVPCGPVRTIEEALASPEVAERGMIYEFADGLRVTGSPLRFSDTPVRAPSPPPKLGEHSDAILRDVLGYDADRINALRAANVIA
jgi:crotonobetainyl-CoA:carnitine CoA-transferase CaiB-like acyl-CoA transferase